jgi:hypothetical protein
MLKEIDELQKQLRKSVLRRERYNFVLKGTPCWKRKKRKNIMGNLSMEIFVSNVIAMELMTRIERYIHNAP